MEVSAKATYRKGALSRFADGFEGKLQKTILKEAEATQKDFQRTTTNWKTEVVFEIRELAPVGARVRTGNLTYVGVSEGTPPHDIYAKPGKRLFFNQPFGAKTKPGSLASGTGSIGSDLWVAVHVHHPGTKARDFNAQIKKKARPRYKKRVQTLVKTTVG